MARTPGSKNRPKTENDIGEQINFLPETVFVRVPYRSSLEIQLSLCENNDSRTLTEFVQSELDKSLGFVWTKPTSPETP
jgi:hypothetical protein